jgi:hypothetical protein
VTTPRDLPARSPLDETNPGGAVAPGRFAEPPGDQAPVARCVQVGEQDGERLAHDPAAVHGDPESPEREPGTFEVEQLTAGEVDRDLLRVALPAAGLALGIDRGAPPGGTEQFGNPRQAYPP